jgi:hypothetical protein
VAGLGVGGTGRRRGGRIGGPERGERDLGVDVGAVLGEDREDQLADGVEAGLPDGPTGDLGQSIEDEGDETRALDGKLSGPLAGDRSGVRAGLT